MFNNCYIDRPKRMILINFPCPSMNTDFQLLGVNLGNKLNFLTIEFTCKHSGESTQGLLCT